MTRSKIASDRTLLEGRRQRLLPAVRHLPQGATDFRSIPLIIRTVASALLGLALAASDGIGQETGSKTPQEPPITMEAVVVDDIEKALKQLDESKDLDDSTKSQLKELYAQAKTRLEEARARQEAAAKFRSWIDSAGKDLADASGQKDAPVKAYDFDAAKLLDLNRLIKDRASLEQQSTDAKRMLTEAQNEPQRRVTRRTEIPIAIAAAQDALRVIDEELKTIGAANDPPVVAQARTILLRARRQAESGLLSSLESERDAYEAQGELPRLRIDVATAQVKQLEQIIRDLATTISERRKIDAAAQREDAEAAWRAAPAELKSKARRNIELAIRRVALANEFLEAVAHREQTSKQLKRWQRDFTRTTEYVGRADSETIGPMLIEKGASLPSTVGLEQEIRAGEVKLREYRAELFKLEDRREELSDISTAVATAATSLRESGVELSAEAEAVLAELFRLESQILDSLLDDASRHYSLRIEARADQEALVRFVQDYRSFIEARVFGVRSAPPLAPSDISNAGQAMAWLFNVDDWREAGNALTRRVARRPFRALLLAVGVVLLLVFRQRIRGKLVEVGRIASPVSCRTMSPTIQAVGLTVLLAAPWPLLAWGAAWSVDGTSNALFRAASIALGNVVLAILFLEAARQTCLPGGLAESHFGWSTHEVSILRPNFGLLLFIGIPLALLFVLFASQRNPLYEASAGRLALIAFLLLAAYTLHRVFRPKSGVLSEMREQNPGRWLIRSQSVWHPVVALVPVVLALLSIIGFQYTSYRLTLHLWSSLEFFLVLTAVGALVFRWVRVQRRRIRWQQLIDARRRSTEEDEEESESSDLDALAAQEEQLDLVAMDHQTRRLISVLLVCLGVIGLYAIWVDVIPAFSPWLEKTLWSVAAADGSATEITVGSVILAAFIVLVAIFASRNIPGFVDALLLGRLGVEASTRYAVSTLSQYAIGIVGVLVTGSLIGFTWSKAQWLIAALSVGLGFGLQEVVANFVCGILLLFERPIRVGDTVTLGETTGVVVRIRSRATTVRNWDRQEVVIPNKELITGRIVNWTLTDQLNRIVIPVGVAYGTDTDYVRELLFQIVDENPNVLDDPRPIVTFEQFGDSTLNFVVRVHLENMDKRRETIHELHTSINRRFIEGGIEIAFPQRDLHLRSVDPSIRREDIPAEQKKK